MKTKHIAMALTSALLTIGLVPLGVAQEAFGPAQEGIEVITVVGKRAEPAGIEVITVVGKRAAPEGIEVVTVVGKRPEPTVASACVNEVMASRFTGTRNGSDDGNAQALETRQANWNSAREAIRNCIEQAQLGTSHS